MKRNSNLVLDNTRSRVRGISPDGLVLTAQDVENREEDRRERDARYQDYDKKVTR